MAGIFWLLVGCAVIVALRFIFRRGRSAELDDNDPHLRVMEGEDGKPVKMFTPYGDQD